MQKTRNFLNILRASMFLILLFGYCSPQLFGQSEGGWVQQDQDPNFSNRPVRTKELVLYPAPENRPALKYQLIPSDFHQLEGNAAAYYLRAIGFPEMNNARLELDRIWTEAYKESQKKGVSVYDLPPYSWQGMRPHELPLEEVKKYLSLTEFQAREIAGAHVLKTLDFSRNLRDVDSPLSILLSEIQSFRELARTQSLRCRVAIAEGRIDDAIKITGHQFRMANHLSQDPILVSNLIGIAIFGIGWDDALELLQAPDTPNLFWAFASLPKPLVPLEKSLAFEKEWVTSQLKALKEVDERFKPAGYWQAFIDQILPQYGFVESEFDVNFFDRTGLINLIAAGYPTAKRYLIEEEKMDTELVESYTTAQVFFLAQKKYAAYASDEAMKWALIDFHQRFSLDQYQQFSDQLSQESAKTGWAALPTDLLLPYFPQITQASTRVQLQIATLMAIEGIRQYAAAHDGQLPAQLSDLPYPVPEDPFTGQPLRYELAGDTATLIGDAGSSVYKLKLRIAKQ